MLRSSISNHNIEKVEFLPDEIMIYVSRDWCNTALRYLRKYEYYGDLLDRLDYSLSIRNVDGRENYPVHRYILMAAGDIKKLVSICGGETLCCNFPYNYEDIANTFLEDKLGTLKSNIEILMDEDMVDDVFKIIDDLDDEYLIKLALIYVKYLYNKKMEAIIDEINVSRKRVLGIINRKLYL